MKQKFQLAAIIIGTILLFSGCGNSTPQKDTSDVAEDSIVVEEEREITESEQITYSDDEGDIPDKDWIPYYTATGDMNFDGIPDSVCVANSRKVFKEDTIHLFFGTENGEYEHILSVHPFCCIGDLAIRKNGTLTFTVNQDCNGQLKYTFRHQYGDIYLIGFDNRCEGFADSYNFSTKEMTKENWRIIIRETEEDGEIHRESEEVYEGAVRYNIDFDSLLPLRLFDDSITYSGFWESLQTGERTDGKQDTVYIRE